MKNENNPKMKTKNYKLGDKLYRVKTELLENIEFLKKEREKTK